VKITYNGKHADIAVGLPGGKSVVATRGVAIEVDAKTAKILNALPGWTKSAPVQPVTVSEESTL